MGKVWDLDLPHNQLLVLLALADHADHEGNNVFPSLGLVAWKTGYSEQQVRRVMRSLVIDGILITTSRNPGKPNRYSIDLAAGKLKTPRVITPTKMSGVSKSNPLHLEGGDNTPTPDMLSAKNDGEPSLEPSSITIPKKSKQKPDPFYDAIAAAFKINASGQIVCIRAMMQGNAKRGTWNDCNFEPPVTDPAEITAFGEYMTRRMRDQKITQPITAAVTIQRWFYDYRAAQAKKMIYDNADYIPVDERTSVLDGIKLA